MTLRTYPDLVQGTEDWLAARRGIVTASVVGQLITPKTVQVAANADTRALTALLVAERITGWTEETYAGHDMWRGHMDEPVAREVYGRHYAPVTETGFMVRDDGDIRVGYSPDGLVGDDGLIEVKSRVPKIHLMTVLRDEVPLEFMAQIQCGLYVSGRQWCDFVSFCGGMPLYVKRVEPDERWQAAIVAAVTAFETAAAEMVATYTTAVAGRPATERTNYDMDLVI